MRARLHRLAVPAYLFLCLVLGGSIQGEWHVMVLQLLAVALIGWAALAPKRESLTGASRSLLLLVILALLLVLVQLVPLPPEIWTKLPGRELVASGFDALGYSLPWLPISMAPYDTLAASLALLPPIAVLAGILRLHAYQEKWLAWALVAGTLLGVLLGVVQTVRGLQPGAWWFLYDITNPGAVGFFANRNHMGTLLLTSIPFTIALLAAYRRKGGMPGNGRGRLAFGSSEFLSVLGGLAFLLLLVGIALNQSSAAVSLALPVIAFSALLLPGSWRVQRIVFITAAVLTVVALLLFTSSPVFSELIGTNTTSIEARQSIWGLTWSAISDSFPLGTGIGSFEEVYRAYEDPAGVSAVYVNNAHNDYLEILLEAGLAGLLLIAGFLAWWTVQVVRVWRSPLSSQVARAATIASGAVLAHSIVDYPLRTPAIAAVFAACIGLMAMRWREAQDRTKGELRGARHLKIG